LTPTALFVLASAAILLLLGLSGAVRADYDTFAHRWGSPDSVWSLAGAIRMFYTFALPPLLGAACCFFAGKARAALRWPVIGVVLMSIVGSAFTLGVCWPHGGNASGAICMRVAVPPFPGSTDTLLRIVATSALTLGPYLWWRRSRFARIAE
jgi:hypothetical protein